jgi:hypothetical protein
MSFDLAILSAAKPLDPDAASEAYHRLAKGEAWAGVLAADPRIGDFVKDITGRWPQPDDLPEEQLDSCPWVSSFDITPASVWTGIQWNRAGDVGYAVIETAKRHGLYVFDPQEGLLHSPGRQPQPITPRPREARICAGCGKAIPPGEFTVERSGQPGLYHIKCLLGRRDS